MSDHFTGVVAPGDVPKATLSRAVRSGLLRPILPGIYLPPAYASDLRWRIAAVMRWNSAAVVTHTAAAHLLFWPQLMVREIWVAARTEARRPGFRFSERNIPDEYIVTTEGMRLTSVALTAVDLMDAFGADAVDRALRSRLVRIGDLSAALTALPYRAGNREKRRLLLRSRAAPWTEAERALHHVLRASRITGWQANFQIRADGRTSFIDVAFPDLMLAIEIDGPMHGSTQAHRLDIERQNRLVLAGWLPLRFTNDRVTDDPRGVIAEIRRGIALCERSRQVRWNESVSIGF